MLLYYVAVAAAVVVAAAAAVVVVVGVHTYVAETCYADLSGLKLRPHRALRYV